MAASCLSVPGRVAAGFAATGFAATGFAATGFAAAVGLAVSGGMSDSLIGFCPV